MRSLHIAFLIIQGWLLILIGSMVIFRLIVPMPEIISGRLGIVATAVLKAVSALVLVGVWVLILQKSRDYIFRKASRQGKKG